MEAKSPPSPVALAQLGRRRPFYGWWIVAASSLLALGEGAWFYGATAFFDPIRQTFGWSSTVTSVAFMLQEGEIGLAAPLIGLLLDRVHPRWVVMACGLVAGLGLLALATTQGLWQFYLAFVLIALGFSGAGPMVGYVVIAWWFIRKRGRAMAVLAAGTAVSGLGIPAMVWGIEAHGWRPTLVGFAVAVWALSLPLSLLFRRRPEEEGVLPDGEPALLWRRGEGHPAHSAMTPRQAWRNRSFWLLGMAFALWTFAHAGLIVHIVPALSSMGVSLATAGVAAGAIPVTSLVGRLGLGVLADFLPKRAILAFAQGLMALGVVGFAGVGFVGAGALLWGAVVLYSVGFGGFFPVVLALQADYFGRRHIGSIQGSLLSLATVGGALGPIFAGWVFDTVHSYLAALLAFAGVVGLSMVALALAPAPGRALRPRGATL